MFPLCLTMCLDVAHEPVAAGAAAALMLLGGYLVAGLAPFGLGAVRDLTGSFSASLWVLFGTALLLVVRLPAPVRDPTEARMSDRPRLLLLRVTGGMSVPGQSAAIPVTPEEIVESAVAANAAGAAIVHVHVREPGDRQARAPTSGLFKEVVAGIRERCDAIVQPTTGGGVGMTIEERARVVTEIRPEMATFNCGSFNFGIFKVQAAAGDGAVGGRVPARARATTCSATRSRDIHRLSELFREAGTKPEYEVYDVGHLYNLRHLADEGLVDFPLHIQFVLGVLGANAATIEQLVHMHRTAIGAVRRRVHVVGGRRRLPGRVPPGRHGADDGRPRAGRPGGQPAGRDGPPRARPTPSSSRRR